MTPAKKRNTKTAPKTPQPDGSLQLALTQLENAVAALTHPRGPHQHSRYAALRSALTDNHRSNAHHAPGSTPPLFIDGLKLSIHIDQRTHTLTAELAACKYRPQDSQQLHTIAAELTAFAAAIDDLFAQKPVYLRGHRCPLCKQTHARIKTDDGETVNRPALMITAAGIAICNACHDTWPSLQHLGNVLRCDEEATA